VCVFLHKEGGWVSTQVNGKDELREAADEGAMGARDQLLSCINCQLVWAPLALQCAGQQRQPVGPCPGLLWRHCQTDRGCTTQATPAVRGWRGQFLSATTPAGARLGFDQSNPGAQEVVRGRGGGGVCLSCCALS